MEQPPLALPAEPLTRKEQIAAGGFLLGTAGLLAEAVTMTHGGAPASVEVVLGAVSGALLVGSVVLGGPRMIKKLLS